MTVQQIQFVSVFLTTAGFLLWLKEHLSDALSLAPVRVRRDRRTRR